MPFAAAVAVTGLALVLAGLALASMPLLAAGAISAAAGLVVTVFVYLVRFEAYLVFVLASALVRAALVLGPGEDAAREGVCAALGDRAAVFALCRGGDAPVLGEWWRALSAAPAGA